VSYLNSAPGLDYLPGEFNLPDNYNVLQISEIHAFEELSEAGSESYSREVAQQVNSYVDRYSVDEIHVMGDTGTFDDVYNFLDELETGPEVVLVAGDEDKKRKRPGNLGDNFTGFFTQINSLQPFDVEVEYTILDEGFEKEIGGNRFQATHHPKKSKRGEGLKHPDTRDDSLLNDFFSVERYSNDRTAETVIYSGEKKVEKPETGNTEEGDPELYEDITVEAPPSLQDLDIAVYDHLHMPYPRTVGDTIVLGLGGRKNNHDISPELPKKSIHLTSFGENKTHHLHFDAGKDRIFEHQFFRETDQGLQMLDVEIPEEINPEAGYRPLQKRFLREKIPEEAYELDEHLPETFELAKQV